MKYSFLDFISGNVPIGIWGLVALLVITWFVIWYIYHFSKILSKKRFFVWGIGFTFFFIFIYLLFWFRYPLPKDKTRILLTFQNQPEVTDQFAEIYTLQYFLYLFLSANLSPDNYLVSHPDWFLQVANSDSLSHFFYRQKIANFMHTNYVLDLKKPNGAFLSDFILNNKSDFDTLLHKNLNLSLEDIRSYSIDILQHCYEKNNSSETILPKILNEDWDLEIWNNWAKGKLAFLNQDLDYATKYFQNCLQLDAGFVPAMLGLAKIELDSARYHKQNGGYFQEHLAVANSYLLKSKKSDVLNDETYRLLGEYGILFENFVFAEENLKKGYSLNPNIDQLYVHLTRLHPSRYKELRFINEESLFKNALFINPSSITAHLWYGDFLFRQNRHDEAIILYQSFLEFIPNQFDLQFALGKLYISIQDYSKAEFFFENLLVEGSDKINVIQFNLGITKYHQGDTLKAQKIFEEIAETKSNPDVYLYLAEILENQGNLDQAIFYLRKRIRENRGLNDPYKEEARKHLVRLLNKQNKNN